MRAADDAGPPPCHPSSPSRDTAPGLGCSAAGSGTQTDTSRRTGPRGRPGRTCSLSRSPSGKARGTGRRFPAWEIEMEKDGGYDCLTAASLILEVLHLFHNADTYTPSRQRPVPGEGHLTGLARARVVEVALGLHQIIVPPCHVREEPGSVCAAQHLQLLLLLCCPTADHLLHGHLKGSIFH